MERLVSVIIPAYNAAPYVREAVDSVLNQTHEQIEIIVVDDGSTDGTRELLEPYARDGKIAYLFEKNMGPAAARNAGIAVAHGEFIAFLDADDTWIPEKLARQLPLFDDSGVALVYADMRIFGAAFPFASYGQMAGPFERGTVIRPLIRRNFIANSSAVIRASVLEDVGLFNEDKKFFAVEDYEFYLRVAARHAVDFTSETLGSYRIHDGQISHSASVGYNRLVALYSHIFNLPDFKTYKPLILLKYAENKIKSFFF